MGRSHRPSTPGVKHYRCPRCGFGGTSDRRAVRCPRCTSELKVVRVDPA